MTIKINKQLILEAFNIKQGVSNILNFLKIDSNKLMNFIKNTDIKNKKIITESSTFAKPSKRIEGKVLPIDTCYTAAMKMIGREDILKSTESNLDVFLDKYIRAQDRKPLVKIDNKNITKLKRGHVLLLSFDQTTGPGFEIKMLNKFGKNGLESDDGWFRGNNGHMGIVVNTNPIMVLHNTYRLFDHGHTSGLGTRLELVVENMEKRIKRDIGENKTNYVLDINIINKIK
jgi:hypothetical protein